MAKTFCKFQDGTILADSNKRLVTQDAGACCDPCSSCLVFIATVYEDGVFSYTRWDFAAEDTRAHPGYICKWEGHTTGRGDTEVDWDAKTILTQRMYLYKYYDIALGYVVSSATLYAQLDGRESDYVTLESNKIVPGPVGTYSFAAAPGISIEVRTMPLNRCVSSRGCLLYTGTGTTPPIGYLCADTKNFPLDTSITTWQEEVELSRCKMDLVDYAPRTTPPAIWFPTPCSVLVTVTLQRIYEGYTDCDDPPCGEDYPRRLWMIVTETGTIVPPTPEEPIEEYSCDTIYVLNRGNLWQWTTDYVCSYSSVEKYTDCTHLGRNSYTVFLDWDGVAYMFQNWPTDGGGNIYYINTSGILGTYSYAWEDVWAIMPEVAPSFSITITDSDPT